MSLVRRGWGEGGGKTGWREVIGESMGGIQNVFLMKSPSFLSTVKNNYFKGVDLRVWGSATGVVVGAICLYSWMYPISFSY